MLIALVNGSAADRAALLALPHSASIPAEDAALSAAAVAPKPALGVAEFASFAAALRHESLFVRRPLSALVARTSAGAEEEVYHLLRLQQLMRTRLLVLRRADSLQPAALLPQLSLSARLSWHAYFMNVAYAVARRANCLRRQVGAVVVLNNVIISSGYNGTPRGALNCRAGGCARCADPAVAEGAELGKCLCLHAEMNAIVKARHTDLANAVLYCTTIPCEMCTLWMRQTGLSKIYYVEDYAGRAELLHAEFAGIFEKLNRPL